MERFIRRKAIVISVLIQSPLRQYSFKFYKFPEKVQECDATAVKCIFSSSAHKNSSFPHTQIKSLIPGPNYSVLKLFTGFLIAALIVFKLTTINAKANMAIPTTTNKPIPMLIR